MHEQTKILLLSDYIKELARKFCRNNLANNPLVKNLTNIRRHNLSFQLKYRLTKNSKYSKFN